MYASEPARKRGSAQKDAERRKQRPCADVYLVKVIDLWNQTKCTTGITRGPPLQVTYSSPNVFWTGWYSVITRLRQFSHFTSPSLDSIRQVQHSLVNYIGLHIDGITV